MFRGPAFGGTPDSVFLYPPPQAGIQFFLFYRSISGRSFYLFLYPPPEAGDTVFFLLNHLQQILSRQRRERDLFPTDDLVGQVQLLLLELLNLFFY